MAPMSMLDSKFHLQIEIEADKWLWVSDTWGLLDSVATRYSMSGI